jgi:hypothetical protein
MDSLLELIRARRAELEVAPHSGATTSKRSGLREASSISSRRRGQRLIQRSISPVGRLMHCANICRRSRKGKSAICW